MLSNAEPTALRTVAELAKLRKEIKKKNGVIKKSQEAATIAKKSLLAAKKSMSESEKSMMESQRIVEEMQAAQKDREEQFAKTEDMMKKQIQILQECLHAARTIGTPPARQPTTLPPGMQMNHHHVASMSPHPQMIPSRQVPPVTRRLELPSPPPAAGPYSNNYAFMPFTYV